MDKAQKHCTNCDTKYTIGWMEEEQELLPLTCPFCGYEVENEEEEVEWVNKNEEEDNWN